MTERTYDVTKIDMAAAVVDRRRELKEFEEAVAQAERHRGTADAMRRERDQLAQRRDWYARHGDRRLTVENPLSPVSPHAFTLEPFRSVKTGLELAADVDRKIAHIDAEVERLEAEASRLMESHAEEAPPKRGRLGKRDRAA